MWRVGIGGAGLAIVAALAATGCSLLLSTGDLVEPPAVDGGADGSVPDPANATAPDGGPRAPHADGGTTTTTGSPYAAEVLADDPLAYLRLDEAAGATVAKSAAPGGKDGTYVGTIAFGAAGAVGDGNTAVTFDGSSSRIDLGDVFAFSGSLPYSLEAWIRPTVVNNTRFVFDRGSAASKEGYSVYYGSGYLLYARSTGAGEFAYVNTGASPPLGNWTHVVATYDGSTNRLYVNAALVESNPNAGPIGEASPGSFAVGDSAQGQFNKVVGDLDEVAVYGKALSLARVQAHYAAAGR